ncbi:MAG TPA: DUF5683 domain-containing protein [Rhodothermales bacterium]
MFSSCWRVDSRTAAAAVLFAGLLGVAPVRGQDVAPDTVPVTLDRSPSGALWRAAVAPGWGQIYNGQYYKLPFVYAGLGGLIASALYNNDRYLLYRHAYLYALDPVENARYADDAAPFATLIAAGQESLLRGQRAAYRRNRDLSYIGVGLFYALTVLDAYVNAHLLDFDVDDDLSIRLMPGVDGKIGVHAAWRLK